MIKNTDFLLMRTILRTSFKVFFSIDENLKTRKSKLNIEVVFCFALGIEAASFFIFYKKDIANSPTLLGNALNMMLK